MKSSRYVRPPTLPNFVLQRRDVQTLQALHRHRFLHSDHIHQLLFDGCRMEVAQRRLRKLWCHKYVERYYRPLILDGRKQPPRSAQPIYALGERGAELVAETLDIDIEQVTTGFPQSESGVPTMTHHLVVSDFFVALTVALADQQRTELVGIEHEHRLWPKVTPFAQGREFVVPDAAFTLCFGDAEPLTFYVEVVRAGIRAGNKSLKKKMDTYVRLNRKRFFRDVYGHDRLRAVIFATTTDSRADRYRGLAVELPHGHGLFWFGSYAEKNQDGHEVSILAPEMILEPRWTDPNGTLHSIIPAAEGERA